MSIIFGIRGLDLEALFRILVRRELSCIAGLEGMTPQALLRISLPHHNTGFDVLDHK